MNRQLELLAPVGSEEALEAAIINGADAVYLGGKLFNARQYASNFDNEQLVEAVSYAHLRDVSVFVTVNILLDDKEIPDALDYVKYLYEIGVDGIIVQDMGLASLVRKIFPKLQIHASTQMTINNLEGARHLEELGFSRAVLAREVPYEEIAKIAQGSKLKLEVFIHGALCFSYSGQCLMSSLIGGRSGNRGTCAQPCRMEYSIIDKNGSVLRDFEKGHYLSTRDLNTLDEIGKLIKVGVKSFKIEGRMKRPEYVATVVNAYRKAIDNGSASLTEQDRIDVEQMFNREFTKGLTFGDFGRNFVSAERPDNRGRVVGKVISSEKGRIQVLLSEDVNPGDGLEWDIYGNKRSGTRAQINGKAGQKIWLDRIKDSAFVGSSLRKTSSAELLKSAQDSYKNNDISHSISMSIRIRIGENPVIMASYKEISAKTTGDKPVEMAMKSPISRDRIHQQLSKLGNTVFTLENLTFDIDEDAFITVKELNTLRRDVIDILQKTILDKLRHDPVEDYKEKKSKALVLKRMDPEKPRLTVRVNNKNQFDQLNLDKVDRVYIGFQEGLRGNIKILKDHNVEAYYWSNKILYMNDLDKIKALIDQNMDILTGVSASNIGTVKFLRDNFNTEIHGDIGLNAFNSYTVDYFREIGLKGLTISPELNIGQIKEIAIRTGGETEAIVYGYLPVMIARNCPMAYVKGCKDDSECKNCTYAKGFMLKDRIGKNFRMERGDGFTTIYNSVPLMVLDRVEDIARAGVTSFRLDFTFEDDIREIQEMYYDYLNKEIDRDTVTAFVAAYKENVEITNGHFFRGVL